MIVSSLQGGSFRDSATDKLKWDRRRRWQMSDYGDDASSAAASVVGGDVAAEDSLTDGTGRAIFIGVSTGVLVWAVTRFLGRMFPQT